MDVSLVLCLHEVVVIAAVVEAVIAAKNVYF
jgi:hypothetical protein